MTKAKKSTTKSHSLPHPRVSFPVSGHETAKSIFLQAMQSGRMPHAWLLAGAQGIGKATLAYQFAYYLLSGESKTEHVQSNPVALRIQAGSHADLLVLEAGVNAKGEIQHDIKVEDARQLGTFLRLTSAESRYRVVIIDSVDHMNRNAANAILKLLEEPPAHAVIFLVSHNPGKLLPTIRSRCRVLPLQPLSTELTLQLLAQHSQDIGTDGLSSYAGLAAGAPGMAMSLAYADALSFWEQLKALLQTLPNIDIAKLHVLGDKLASKTAPEHWQLFCFMFPWLLKRIATYKVEIEDTLPGETELVSHLLAKYPLDYWLEMWDNTRLAILDAQRSNLDKKQVFINLLRF